MTEHAGSAGVSYRIISSSHNTYLESDQTMDYSTTQMYRIMLKRGSRCVEIDMWDSDDDNPVIRTVTLCRP